MEFSLNVHMTKKNNKNWMFCTISKVFITYCELWTTAKSTMHLQSPQLTLLQHSLEYNSINWVMCLSLLKCYWCTTVTTWREAGKEVLFLRLTAHLFTRECSTAESMYAAHVCASVFIAPVLFPLHHSCLVHSFLFFVHLSEHSSPFLHITHAHARAHTRAHARTRTRTHTHTHTRTRTRTHTHTHTHREPHDSPARFGSAKGLKILQQPLGRIYSTKVVIFPPQTFADLVLLSSKHVALFWPRCSFFISVEFTRSRK